MQQPFLLSICFFSSFNSFQVCCVFTFQDCLQLEGLLLRAVLELLLPDDLLHLSYLQIIENSRKYVAVGGAAFTS